MFPVADNPYFYFGFNSISEETNQNQHPPSHLLPRRLATTGCQVKASSPLSRLTLRVLLSVVNSPVSQSVSLATDTAAAMSCRVKWFYSCKFLVQSGRLVRDWQHLGDAGFLIPYRQSSRHPKHEATRKRTFLCMEVTLNRTFPWMEALSYALFFWRQHYVVNLAPWVDQSDIIS